MSSSFWFVFLFYDKKKIKQISTFFFWLVSLCPSLCSAVFTELTKAPVSLSAENFALIDVIH